MPDENLFLGPKKLDEQYSAQVQSEWAVTPVSDPCVGDLATPVNSGYFTKAFLNNLPFYRPGLSPNFRGL